jgi:predicted GNAT family N-acyltransferase
MSTRTFEITTEDQYRKALAIRRAVFIEEQNVPEELEIDDDERVCIHVLALDEEGRPVATGRILPYGDGVGKMQRIAVLKEARKKGYGRKVMEALEEIGRAKGYTKFVLEAQVHAEKFYEKLGYVTVSEPFYEAGILHVKMEKEL